MLWILNKGKLALSRNTEFKCNKNTACTDNTNTSIECSTPMPFKGKRSLISTNDLPSPVSIKRKSNKRCSPARVRRRSTGTNNQSLQWGFATRLGLRLRTVSRPPKVSSLMLARKSFLLRSKLFSSFSQQRQLRGSAFFSWRLDDRAGFQTNVLFFCSSRSLTPNHPKAGRLRRNSTSKQILWQKQRVKTKMKRERWEKVFSLVSLSLSVWRYGRYGKIEKKGQGRAN